MRRGAPLTLAALAAVASMAAHPADGGGTFGGDLRVAADGPGSVLLVVDRAFEVGPQYALRIDGEAADALVALSPDRPGAGPVLLGGTTADPDAMSTHRPWVAFYPEVPGGDRVLAAGRYRLDVHVRGPVSIELDLVAGEHWRTASLGELLVDLRYVSSMAAPGPWSTAGVTLDAAVKGTFVALRWSEVSSPSVSRSETCSYRGELPPEPWRPGCPTTGSSTQLAFGGSRVSALGLRVIYDASPDTYHFGAWWAGLASDRSAGVAAAWLPVR